MGIAYGLVRVKPEIVEQMRGRPRAVAAYVFGDASLGEPPKPGFLARLFGKSPPREGEAPITLPERVDGDETDIDKAWQVIHYLLTGSSKPVSGPLGLILDESDTLADLDLGLGPPHIISPAAVKAFAAAVATLSDDQFFARFIPDEMPVSDLYLCDSLVGEDLEDAKDYLRAHFHELRDFAVKAADQGEAIVTFYC